ncbi:MAG TPA: ATPase domain-containing protein [Candidatus Nanoarchaeia archaeon]|nr:ATPase domain-containing protein [Candidatus Nanoarchaeia archaeon]
MTETLTRIPSGILGMDSLVEGGLKKESINLVAGDPGTGKTIFAIQFLMQGIQNGEPGVYITFEEKRDKLYEDMLTFGWNLEEYERKGLFAFLEYTPEQVKKVLVEGGGTIEALIQKIKAQRIAIDSISSFIMLYQDELTQKEAALALFELINSWHCSAILTSQNTQMDQEAVSAALEFEVDSIIVLYHLKVKGIRKRAIEILKMRGTRHPDKTFLLEITPNGLKINPQEVVVF